jgi:23S rRNA pseudouridine1911/1915/1917 synthase
LTEAGVVSTPKSELRFVVPEAQAKARLDQLVAHAAQVSRRIARIWIATGRVRVSGRPVRILTRPMKAGAEIEVSLSGEKVSEGAPRPALPTTQRPSARHAPLGVLYLDYYLLLLDKPAGLLTEHDRFGSPSLESLAPAVLAEAGERGARTKVWLVHRLDAGTSGVVVLARTPTAASALGDAFRLGEVHKTYLALCQGSFRGEQLVDAPIARALRTRHAVSPGGKPARTRVEGLADSPIASLVCATPATGRTHQIRVHMAHLGHPLLGDGLYGGPMYTSDVESAPIGRPMLHAARLALVHPKTGEKLEITAPLPDDFVRLAGRLGLAVPAPWGATR